jgi:hypothetical protein
VGILKPTDFGQASIRQVLSYARSLDQKRPWRPAREKVATTASKSPYVRLTAHSHSTPALPQVDPTLRPKQKAMKQSAKPLNQKRFRHAKPAR